MTWDESFAKLQEQSGTPDPQQFVREQQSKAVDRSVATALQTTPEVAAKHYGIAKREGLSVEEAQRQADQLRVTSALQGFNSDALVVRYPDTAKVFADPKLSAIGWDDLETIKAIEQAQLDLKSAPERYVRSLKGSVESSFQQNEIGLRSAEEVFRTLSGQAFDPENTRELDRLRAQRQQKLDYGISDEGLLGRLAQAPNVALEGTSASLLDYVAGKTAGTVAGSAVGGAVGGAVGLRRRGLSGAAAGVKGGARLGAKVGGGAGGYLSVTAPMVGALWDEMKTTAPDLDPKSRAWLSIAGGAAGGALESVGFEVGIKAGLRLALKDEGWKRGIAVFAASLGEGVTEGAQALVEAVTVISALRLQEPGGALLDPEHAQKALDSFKHTTADGTTYTGIKAVIWRTLESMAQGAQGGAFVAGSSGAVAAAAPMVKAQAARVSQASLEQVVKLAQKSKIAQRNPEAFRDVLNKMAPDKKVYIAAEGVRRFFQDGDNEYDDSASYDRAQGFREQAQQASLTGADMEIPYADWVAFVADTDFGRSTMKDIRASDPRQMTANEADAWEKENFGGMRGVQDLAAEASKASDVERIVRDELTLQIGRKGGSADQIEAEVELQLARLQTRAKRSNRSLRALIKDEGLFTTTVEGETHDLGPSLEQKIRRFELQQAVKGMRSGKTPEARMPKAPMRSLLATRGVDPGSRLGAELRDIVPTSGPGSIPGFWRANGFSEADQLNAFQHEVFTDNALVDETGNLTNGQVADIVRDEMQGKVLRTAAEQYAIQDAKAALNETKQAVEALKIEDPSKLTDAELADLLLAAGRPVSSTEGADEIVTLESEGLKSKKKKKGEKESKEPPRGSIDVTSDLRNVVIRFFKAHDGSTMLHEGGHLWLEQLRKDALRDGTPDQIKRDWAIIKDWLGIRRGDRISEKNSERFARAVEQYMLEGQSPSTKLENVFARYSIWLLGIYKTLRNKYFKDVRLTDPVRGVLDRMLATDAEIFAAQQNRGLSGETLTEEDGLTSEQVTELREAVEAGRQEAEMENVRLQVIRQRRRASKLWKSKIDDVRKEVARAIDSRPDVQASEWLRRGKPREGMVFPPGVEKVTPGKFTKEGLVAVAGSSAVLKVLPSGKYGYYSAEGGYDPAIVAELFGYASVVQLVSDLSDLQNAGGRDAIVARTVQATMERRYGKFETSGELSNAVVEAAANEKAIRALELEDRTLSGRTGKKRLAREVADRIAKSMISKMTVRMILPRKGSPRASERFRAAAEREAKLALKAHANGDLRNMQLHRQRQMVNLAIEREARTVEQRVSASISRIRQLQNPHAQKILGKAGNGTTEFQDQTMQLLERFGFLSSPPGTVKEPARSLSDFVKDWTGKGGNFRIAPAVFNDAFRMDHTRMSTDTFFDVAQSIMSVYGSARTFVELTAGSENAAFETDVDDLTSELNGGTPAREYKTAVTKMEKVQEWKSSAWAALKQMEHVITRIGPAARDILWKPFADAEAEAFALRGSVVEPVAEAYKKLVRANPNAYSIKRSYPSLRTASSINPDGLYSRSDLIMLAFNMMNASNAEKMTKGFGFTEAQVWSIIDAELTDADWDFIELSLDKLESLWAPAVAQELRLTGAAPNPIVARPHTLPSGRVIKGGYFPIIYDKKAIRSLGIQLTPTMRSDTDIFSVTAGLQRVVTGHTHMLARADAANAPMSLVINGLPDHLLSVIHDLTHREPLLKTYRILKDDRVFNAMTKRIGAEETALFMPWISDIAQSHAAGDTATQAWYDGVRNVRARMLIFTLGGRITTLLLQPLGTFTGYVLGKREIGPAFRKYHVSALAQMGQSPRVMADTAMEKSAVMRRRTKTYDRDFSDLLDSGLGFTGRARELGEQAMKALALTQFFSVDVPLWHAAYTAARFEKGAGEAHAIDYADSVVERSQGSGSQKNRSALMRDKGMWSILTMYFTYHNTLFNVTDEGHRRGIKGKDLAVEYLLLFVVPAILAFWQRQLLQEAESALLGIDDPDEERNKLVQMAGAVGAEPMGMWPVIRDASSAVANVGYGRMIDPSTPPEQVMEWAGSVVTNSVRASVAAYEGESPKTALINLAADAASLVSLYFQASTGYAIGLLERKAKQK